MRQEAEAIYFEKEVIAMLKPKQILQAVVVIAAIIVVSFNLTPQTALALFAVLAEVAR